MARYCHARTSFKLGEVSPSAWGMVDSPAYHQMCETLKNFIAKPLGGVTRRPGFKMLVDTFGDSQINDFANVDTVKLIEANFTYDTQGFIILTPDYIKRYSVNSIPYSGGTSHIGAITGLGTKVYNTSNNWHVANAGEGYIEGVENWAQYGNLIVIANGIQEPLIVAGLSSGTERYFLLGEGKLTGLGTLDTFVTQGWTLFPFDPVNATAVTMSLSAVTVGTGRTLTASAATFSSGMVGMYVRFNNGSTVGHALITAFTSSTQVTVTVLSAVDANFLSPAADTEWSLSQWGGTARGWPRAVAFYKERLCFAGNTYMPDGVWLSEIGDLYQFSKTDPTATTTAADPYSVRVGERDAQFVNHLFPKKVLFANTEIKETYLSPIDSSISVGATNTEIQSDSENGASRMQPFGMNKDLIFLGAPENPLGSYYGRKVFGVNFSGEDKNYSVDNLNRFTYDLTRDRCIGASSITTRPYFTRIAVTKKPFPMVWALDTTGRLYSLVWDRAENCLAWSHHPLGGSYLSSDVKVLDIVPCNQQLVIACLRNTGGNADQICYEILSETFAGAVLDENAAFLDYFSTGTVSGAGELTGLTHLNGNTVTVMTGGEYRGTYTVSSNKITGLTSYIGETAVIGYNYESLIVPIALESNALLGSGLGSIKRTHEVIIGFERTVGAKVGILGNETNENNIQFRMAEDPADDPIPLFTGEKKIPLTSPYEGRQNVYVKQDRPFPMDINYMVLKGTLYD